ncbi:MAG TPA: sigma-70 family RNA polymerase sigma factor [Chitinophagaceae bacterium]|jgi:RNA polymerase sigma-70 factor (ECF subfamily)
MIHLSPQQVIGGYNRKEERAITWLYQTYYIGVLNDVIFLTNASSDAEDLTADVFTKLIQYPGEFDSLKKIKFYIFQTAKNVCLNYQRHQSTIKAKSSEIETYYQSLNQLDEESQESKAYFENLVYSAIEKLPPKYKKIYKLYYYEELTNEEIGKQVNLSDKTVANLKNMAKNILSIEIRKKSPSGLHFIILFL